MIQGSCTDETARMVVIGDTSNEGCESQHVCLYRHNGSWHCADEPMAPYAAFCWLCQGDGFAQQAEAGALLVDGTRILAEKYLALWRAAFKAALPVDQVAGVALTWEIRVQRVDFEHNVRVSRAAKIEQGDVKDALAKASKYRVSVADHLMHWSLPFGRENFSRLAHSLAKLGQIRYALPPGSFRRLALVGAPRGDIAKDAKTHTFNFVDEKLAYILINFDKKEGDKSFTFPAPAAGTYTFYVDSKDNTGQLIVE